MRKYILILLVAFIQYPFEGHCQSTIKLYATPNVSDSYYDSNNDITGSFIQVLEKPLLSMGYGFIYEYKFEHISLELDVNHLTFGSVIPKKELTSINQIAHTHYSEKTNFNSWNIFVKGGYYFFQEEKWNLKGNLGLGLSYLSNINYRISLYTNEDIVETINYTEIDNFLRNWNFVTMIEVPFNYHIKQDLGVSITPHFNYWIMNIFPEATFQRYPFLGGCKIGVFKNF